MSMLGKLNELTSRLLSLATGSRDEIQMNDVIVKIWDCVNKVDDDVYDVASAPDGLMDIIAKYKVMEKNGKRGNENIINYVWFFMIRLKLDGNDIERTKIRRHNIISYGWLDLAAEELKYSYDTGKITQSSLNAGSYLWTLCDKETHGAEMAQSSVFKIVVPLCIKYKKETRENTNEFKMMRNVFQCVYNACRWDPCREAFKYYPVIIPLCEELTRHPFKEFSVLAAFTICLISGRDESGAGQELLKRSPGIIRDAYTILEKTIDAGEGEAVDGVIWDPEELTRILMNLSISDANKMMLKPAIPILIKAMVARPANAKMIKEIIVTFMQLAFEKELLKILQDNVAKIEQAFEKANKDADDFNQFKNLMSRLKPELAKQERKASGTRKGSLLANMLGLGAKEKKQPQIMISYNWGSKPTVVKVHSALVEAGYKCWIDLEQMNGNIADRMAEAVENSDAVLLCISSKYKESVNCRQEAEYAHECKKPLIILMMEKGYKANGWLGLMVGRKLWVDCTDEDSPDITGVIREVSSLGLANAAASGDKPPATPIVGSSAGSSNPSATPTHAHGSNKTPATPAVGFSTSSVKVIGNKAAEMTPDDVVTWLGNAKLSQKMQETFQSKQAGGRVLLGIYLSHIHSTLSAGEAMVNFGCLDVMEYYAFLYELEVLLASKNN